MDTDDKDQPEVKQVILMRRDLNMRRGKEIAQGAHAAMAWLSDRIGQTYGGNPRFTGDEGRWLYGNQRKITVQVPDEKELDRLVLKAKEAGLMVHVITDAGYTEFKGQKTVTCAAIGPALSSLIDQVTGDCRLY